MTRVKTPRSARRRRLFWGLYALFILLLVETVLRFFWMSSGLVTFYNVPRRLYWAFYPELETVILHDITNYDADYKILLLGGSSVMPQWGAIEQVLRERLTSATGRPVRIDSLGGEGHTSRDSMLKYKLLARHRYDLVIVYDGINDCRTNNVPPDKFKPDYSHYAWYHLVNREMQVGPRRLSVIPFTFGYAKARFFGGQYLPVEKPSPEMLRYGNDIKSRGPFKQNFAEIIRIAGERGEPVLLMTFASYMPPNYNHELFIKKMLDYTLHSVATGLWGTPTFVARGVAAHNDAIRELANEKHPSVYFVDQAAMIPAEGKYYNDICHLTVAGSERWVDNVMPIILNLFNAKNLPPLATKNSPRVDPEHINMDL